MPRVRPEEAQQASQPAASQKRARKSKGAENGDDEDFGASQSAAAAAASHALSSSESKNQIANIVRFFVFKNSDHEVFTHQHIKDKLNITGSGSTYKLMFEAAREKLKETFGFVVEELQSQGSVEKEADQFTAAAQSQGQADGEGEAPNTQQAASQAPGKKSAATHFIVRSIFRQPKQRELIDWARDRARTGLLMAIVTFLFANHPNDVKEEQLWTMLGDLGLKRSESGKCEHPELGNVPQLIDSFVAAKYITKKAAANPQDREKVYRVGPRGMQEFPVVPLLRGIYGDGTVELADI